MKGYKPDYILIDMFSKAYYCVYGELSDKTKKCVAEGQYTVIDLNIASVQKPGGYKIYTMSEIPPKI